MIDGSKELFATLYAQRLFFLVTASSSTGLLFEPIGRGDARMLLENRLRILRRAGQYSEYDHLQKTYQQTFQ